MTAAAAAADAQCRQATAAQYVRQRTIVSCPRAYVRRRTDGPSRRAQDERRLWLATRATFFARIEGRTGAAPHDPPTRAVLCAQRFAAKPVTRSHACCTRPKKDHDPPHDAEALDHPMKAL